MGKGATTGIAMLIRPVPEIGGALVLLLGRQRGSPASVCLKIIARVGARLLRHGRGFQMYSSWSFTFTFLPAAFTWVFSGLGAAGAWQQPGEAIRTLSLLLPDSGLSLPRYQNGSVQISMSHAYFNTKPIGSLTSVKKLVSPPAVQLD